MLRLILSLCVIIPFFSHAKLQVTAVVSQNPVGVGQSFTLEVSANQGLDSYEFDPQVLLQQGFVVGSTSTSRRHQVINGDSSTMTSWTTSLMVRKTGTYLIPSFNVAGAQTVPIQLVAKDLGYDEVLDDQVRLEVSLSKPTAYLQQAVRYTAKVWVGNALDQANFIEPAALGAEIVRLGDDKQDIEIVDGKRYRTLTRQWLITPKQSGELKVIGPRLNGLASDTYRRNRPVDIQGQTLWLNVKPAPTDFPGTWLPTEDLLLTDELQPQQSSYQQGQAFTRQVVLTIAGITEQQLPEIDIPYSDDFRVYPEAYQDRTIVQDGVVFAQRILNVALIPAKAGAINLPGWEIPWWDTDSDQLQTASIPSKIITVTAEASPIPVTSAATALDHKSCTKPNSSLFPWFLSGLLSITSILLAYLYWRQRHQSSPALKPEALHSSSNASTQHWQQFTAACQQQDSYAAERSLAQWQRKTGNKTCQAALAELAEHNWGKKKPAIDLAGLYKQCQQASKAEQASNTGSSLPSLN